MVNEADLDNFLIGAKDGFLLLFVSQHHIISFSGVNKQVKDKEEARNAFFSRKKMNSIRFQVEIARGKCYAK